MKALLFTYYWPPSGGPAVQRWLSLSRLFSEMGAELTVITVDEKEASYVMLDESLNDEVPQGVRVIKTGTFEPFQLYAKILGKGKLPAAGFTNEGKPGPVKLLARWVRGNLFYPDPRKGWNRHALKSANKLLEHEQFDWVISAGPPHSTHLIAKKIKARYHIPWLADFHDAWTGIWYYNKLLKSSPARKIDRQMEVSVLRKADKITTVGKSLRDELMKLSDEPQDKFHVHSMGYDDELFEDAASIPEDRFTITYVGTMDADYNPSAFFTAVAGMMAKGCTQIRIRFVGLFAEAITEELKQKGLYGISEIIPYKPHAEAVSLLKQSAVLLLINPDTPQATRIIPGKIYEYLATRLPIVNLINPGTETADIISEAKGGKSFYRDQTEEIQTYLTELYEMWQENASSLLNEHDDFKKFSRRTEAIQLLRLLEHRLG